MINFDFLKTKYFKILSKIFFWILILAIIAILIGNLIGNWQQLKEYKFSFNYGYLLISFILFVATMIFQPIIWNRILRLLSPEIELSYLKSIEIYMYSWFAKYLPGKAWMFVGRVYLGNKQGLDNKKLTISTLYEIILSILAAIIFSIITLSVALKSSFLDFYRFDLYLISILIIIGSLIFIHPRIFYFFAKLILKKFNQLDISKQHFLKYANVLEILFEYLIFSAINSMAFFFLVISIADFPFDGIIGLSGAYIFSSLVGILVIFSPSGLGVKESVLTVFLQPYFPLSVAILISLLSRVWTTLGEILTLAIVFIFVKFKKHWIKYLS